MTILEVRSGTGHTIIEEAPGDYYRSQPITKNMAKLASNKRNVLHDEADGCSVGLVRTIIDLRSEHKQYSITI